MIIQGRNAVTEAVKNATVEKVLVLKDAPKQNNFTLIKLCRERKITVQFVEKQALERLSPAGRHQGVIAVTTEFNYSDPEEILEKKDGKPLLILLLDGIEDPHNLGAIIRVAECAGVNGILLPRRRCCPVTDTAVKVSCGASEYVKVAKVGNINDAIRDLKERGIFVLAADMDGESIYSTDLTGDIAIVIGGEGSGVHSLTGKLCDGKIALPQFGQINSLNASVATGIVVYEAVRQREKYGK